MSSVLHAAQQVWPLLVHALWQGAVIGIATIAAIRVFRLSAPDRARLAFGAMMAMPLSTLLTWRALQPSALGLFAGNGGLLKPPTLLFGANGAAVLGVEWSLRDQLLHGAPLLLTVLWALGAILLCARHLGGILWLRRRFGHGAPPPAWLALATHDLAKAVGITRAVRVVISDAAYEPFTFGFLWPVVVVPAAMVTGIPAQDLKLLVHHELRHIARFDFGLNALAGLVARVYFFHPVSWWLMRELATQRECACDGAVVEDGVDPLAYARALLLAAEASFGGRQSGLGAVPRATGGNLTFRIERILGAGAMSEASDSSMAPSRRRAAGGLAVVGVMAFAALLTGGLSACGSSAAPSAVSAGNGLVASSADDAHGLGVQWLPPAVTRHRALIEQEAKRHDVPADLIAIVILVESGGDPAAISSAGATGLMQLMPKTANSVAGKSLSASELATPATNVTLGARLLKLLLDRYANEGADQVRLALAGYNGGQRAADRLRDGKDGLSKETTRYIAFTFALWQERQDAASKTYDARRSR